MKTERHKIQDTSSKQTGQVIIILLLLMLVGLSIGLALTQRSVTDVSISTQSEQSSRAFSAAEAGIEKALSGSPLPVGGNVTFNNNSSAQVNYSNFLPAAGSFDGIEYPPIGRETTAHFWFVDPSAPTPVNTYNNDVVDLFFGNEGTTEKPAVEVVIIMKSGSQFYTKTYYYDSDIPRAQGAGGNGFDAITPPCSDNSSAILDNGILGDDVQFFCNERIGRKNGGIVDEGDTSKNCPNPVSPCILILARVRLLYVNENHKIALAPVGGGVQFPPQVQIYNAVGTSGQSQKQVQAFRVRDVIPPWFDFALFSVNEISK